MADVVVTSSAVRPPASARLSNGTAGEAVSAGDFLYYKSDLLWWKADCLSLEKSGGMDPNLLKIAMCSAVAGQSISLLNPNQIMTMNAGLTKGIYVISKTAEGGKIMPPSDLVATNILAEAGYAISTTQFYFGPVKSGVVI